MNNIFLRKKLEMLKASLSTERPYYCEVEYLESTGTQYIDTGFVPSSNTRVLFDYKPTDNYTGVSCIFGCQTTPANNNCNRFYYLLSGQTLYKAQFNYTNTATSSQSTPAYWGINYDSSTNQYSLTTGANGTFASNSGRQTIDIDGYNKTVQFNNGNIIDMSNDATFAKGMSPTYSMFIFDRSLAGISSNTKFKGKIYYFKIWDSGILVKDFIPVLDWEYTPCLYDKVTGTLFYNAGTGTFNYGREIHEVEYIESDGNQRIDTEITSYCRFKCVAQSNISPSANTVLFSGTDDARGGAYFGALANGKWGAGTTTGFYVDVPVTTKAEIDVNFTSTGCSGTVNNKSFNRIVQTTIQRFTLFQSTRGQYAFIGKLFECEAYINDVLVRDFIPSVDENGVGFLFDRVNRTIYDNIGTGSFGYPDVELEYIESSGTQYIDTGILPSSTLLTDIDFSVTNNFTFSTASFLLGSYAVQGGNYTLYSAAIASATELRFPSGNTFSNLTIPTISTTKHNLKYEQGSQVFDDSSIGTLSGQQAVSTNVPNIWLFGRNSNNNTNYITGNIKVYRVNFSDNGTEVKNLIPVIHNGTACLKDTLSNTYLTNAGTGDFVIGKIKEKRY